MPITEPDANMPKHPAPGFCVWLTGLSGAGKSTIATCLHQRLERRGRRVTVLDGDAVRTHLSRELGFSKADRDTNVRRIAFVASEVVKHGGAVIVAAVSPYEAARQDARAMVAPEHFLLAFVDTPLSVCEKRDVKALYAKARRGELPGFTGIDDPYEVPANPDVALDTTASTPEDCAEAIEHLLMTRGLLEKIGLVQPPATAARRA